MIEKIMRRRGELAPFLAFCLVVSLGVLLYFEPWKSDTSADFRVRMLLPADAPLARNQTLTLEFDRPIHRETPVEALVHVRDPLGRNVELVIERRGKNLLVQARDPLGWPAPTTLDLEVSPGLAVPFRAEDESRLSAEFSARLQTVDRYIDLGTSFQLKRRSPLSLVAVRLGTEFRFTSDLPLDRRSLEGGRAPATLVVLGDEREQRGLKPEIIVGADERSLVIRPWLRAEDFVPDRRHRLTIHKGRLSSLTGRSLERDLVIEFRSARDPSREGQIEISFAKEDLSEESAAGLSSIQDHAQPTLTLFTSVELGSKELQAEKSRIPIFGPEPRRMQILVPGHHLGQEPGLLTGFAFFAAADPVDPETVLHQDLFFPRVIFRVGEASEATAQGLTPDPGLNLKDLGMRETVVAGSREGELFLRARKRRGAYGEWIDLLFERPYTYRGGNRDLILEIINDGGAFALEGAELPEGFSGPRWVASSSRQMNPQQRPMSLEVAGPLGENPVGIPSLAIFATKIHIERYHDFVSRWYAVDLGRPTWFRVPAEENIDAMGLEGRDFVFDFQGQNEDGELSSWTRLDELAGCRKIRARLRFLPDADWRHGGVQVRRLRIGYRDGR